MQKTSDAFRTISEVADDLQIPQHVLRFWETKFNEVSPIKKNGGRRYYRPEDIITIKRIADLLYIQGYTIKGVQKLFSEEKNKASSTMISQELKMGHTTPVNHSAAVEHAVEQTSLVQKAEIVEEKKHIQSSKTETILLETLKEVMKELEHLKNQIKINN